MITIKNECKPLLNVLLGYYRKEYAKTSDMFLAKNFVKDKYGNPICHVSTLSKMEHNIKCCRDEIYYALFENLNIPIEANSKINALMHSVDFKILKLAEFNYSKKIIKLLNDSLKILNPYKTHAFYRERIELYKIFLAYYTSTSFNKEQIDKALLLYELIPEPCRPVFITIAYHYYSRVHIEENLSLDIIKLGKNLKVKSIISEHLKNTNYIRTQNIIKLKEQSLKMIRMCELENNKYYLTKAYNNLAFVYVNSEPALAEKYLALSIKSFDHENDTIYNLCMSYENYVNIAFQNKDYKKVIELYENLPTDKTIFLKIKFIYLICSYSKTSKNANSQIQILHLIRPYISDLSPLYQAIFHFFDAIYVKQDFKAIELAIYNLFSFQEELTKITTYKNIILEETQKVCMKYHASSLYNKCMKHFQ